MQDDGELHKLARAIVAGTRVDWASAESTAADESLRNVIRQLKVIAEIADVHASAPLPVEFPTTVSVPQATSGILGTWGPLRLLEKVGRGAHGEVYRAWDPQLHREVALKLLSGSSAGGSIIQEGRLLARVRHPNVVTIYGAERVEHRIGLWMEFVKGLTLEQLLKQGKAFSAAEAIEIGAELCQAISAVHHAGLLHRDIKAHNVMLAEDGHVVLMDFGTGRELNGGSASDFTGTPLYLAPELLSGGDATIRSDIYSAGVLLYHLLTGAYPVWARSIEDLRLAHQRNERTDVRSARPDLPSKLAGVVNRAIDPQPERRYPTADALRAALGALKPSGSAHFAYATRVAAVILMATAMWEVVARQTGFPTPIPRLASLMDADSLGAASISRAGPPVIAVLPFENLSREPESDYLVEGLTDEIIRNLAVVKGLQVRSRTSSFAFKEQPRNLRDVGQQLGANLVIEGSVLRSGNRLRINAQLVEVAGDVPLWAERFDRDLEDIFAIQDEISRAIVEKLRLTFGTGQRRYDLNIDIYLLYLKAREVLSKRGRRDAKAARDLFQQVVEQDSGFAPAYAGLAEAYGLLSHQTLSPEAAEAALPLMQQAASKALQLDPLLAEGHAAMGFVHAWQYDWENARKSFRRAIDVNPSLTQTYLNYWTTTLLPLERLEEAEPLLQVAMRTDPRSPIVHHELGFLRLVAGQFDEAIDDYKRARDLDADLPYVDQHLGRALTFAGRWPEALSLWETRRDPYGKGYWKDQPGGHPWLAAAYVKAGRRSEVERMAEMHDEPYRLALIHAALGNKDRTFEELNRAAQTVPHRVAELLAYPEMRLLRGDPRRAALRKILRLQ
jgi:eukaryotic-like serine/threonine-protein kinase